MKQSGTWQRSQERHGGMLFRTFELEELEGATSTVVKSTEEALKGVISTAARPMIGLIAASNVGNGRTYK